MNAHPVDRASKGFSHSLRTHGIKIMPWLPADSETIPAPCGSSSDVGGHLAVKSAFRKMIRKDVVSAPRPEELMLHLKSAAWTYAMTSVFGTPQRIGFTSMQRCVTYRQSVGERACSKAEVGIMNARRIDAESDSSFRLRA